MMAKGSIHPTYPVAPLLTQYRRTPGLSPTFAADVLPLRSDWLDALPDDQLAYALQRLAASALPVSFHSAAIIRHVRFLRHALAHLLRGQDALVDRLSRCVTPGEAYHIPGLGPGFWSAVVRLTNLATTPLWCPAVERGLHAIGLFPEKPRGHSQRLAALLGGHEQLRGMAPDLKTAQFDDFLERVSRMTGRELPSSSTDTSAFAWAVGQEEIRRAVREVRTQIP